MSTETSQDPPQSFKPLALSLPVLHVHVKFRVFSLFFAVYSISTRSQGRILFSASNQRVSMMALQKNPVQIASFVKFLQSQNFIDFQWGALNA